MRSVEKDIMDNNGHEATHHHTKIHKKEDGKVVEKEMAKEHNNGGKSKGGKGGTQGKGKGKGKKASTSQRNHRTSIKSVDKRLLVTLVRSIVAKWRRQCELARSRWLVHSRVEFSGISSS